MTTRFDKIQRGLDSSGRPLFATRQMWQFTDRLNNEVAGGILVPIQGGWSFATDSANTHGLAMCIDYRVWNLSIPLRTRIAHQGRDWMGTMWVRLEADGFDPHLHNNLIGDKPATSAAAAQVPSYKAGRNGLANNALDRDPYRKKPYTNYRYIQEEDMTPDEAQRLKHIETMLENHIDRDATFRTNEKERFQRMVTLLGGTADQLTVAINQAKDDATKNQLKKVKENILLQLKNDPDVTKQDNPADDALAEQNMG
jgi:hypothetical protein